MKFGRSRFWSLIEAAADRLGTEIAGFDMHFGSLWSRKGLIRYILTCCQDSGGGLKDKPRMRPDYYHSNYVLIGLSAAQHYYFYDEEIQDIDIESPFKHAFRWRGSRNVPKPSTKEGYGGGWEEGLVDVEDNRLVMQHPIFNIPLGAEKQIQNWWIWSRASGTSFST